MKWPTKLAWRVLGLVLGLFGLYITLAVQGVHIDEPSIEKGILAGVVFMGIIGIVDSVVDGLARSR